MESTLGHSAQIFALLLAIFFAMFAVNGLFNFYLRSVDRLPIDRADVKSLARHGGFAVFFAVIAVMFRFMPFTMALCFVICGYLISLIIKSYIIGNQLNR